jgi:hypothetical protein
MIAFNPSDPVAFNGEIDRSRPEAVLRGVRNGTVKDAPIRPLPILVRNRIIT